MNHYLKTTSLIGIFIISLFSGCTLFNAKSSHKEEIKFGAILALTGEAASYGDMMKKGMDIALEEINSDSTNKYTYKIIYEDSKSTPSGAINAAKKLIELDKVNMITCITASKNALAVCPLANEKGILIIDALSSAAKLTTEGGKSFFRLMPSDNYSGAFIADWALSEGYKRAAIMYANDDWGNGIKEVAKKKFEEGNGTTFNEGINVNQNDFKNILIKVKDFKPDVIFLLTYAPEAGILVKQARESGIDVAYFGSDNLSAGEFSEGRESIVENVRFCLPAEGVGIPYQNLKKKYEGKYKENISVNSIKSYDVIKLAAHVIESTDKSYDNMCNYLVNNLKDYYGASGLIEFDNNGDIKTPVYDKMIYKNGSYVPLPSSN